jgi:hypothetical protein
MDEIQLIRNQLAAQRQHASAVANACARALEPAGTHELAGGSLGEFRQACVDYLVCVLAWFEERDQRLSDFARVASADAARRTLEEALGRPGRSREALEKLEKAVAGARDNGDTAAAHGTQQSWQEFARYFNGVWNARRDAIDALLAQALRASDWRAVAGIDADSILEERQRYARVRAALAPDASLAELPAAAR